MKTPESQSDNPGSIYLLEFIYRRYRLPIWPTRPVLETPLVLFNSQYIALINNVSPESKGEEY